MEKQTPKNEQVETATRADAEHGPSTNTARFAAIASTTPERREHNADTSSPRRLTSHDATPAALPRRGRDADADARRPRPPHATPTPTHAPRRHDDATTTATPRDADAARGSGYGGSWLLRGRRPSATPPPGPPGPASSGSLFRRDRATLPKPPLRPSLHRNRIPARDPAEKAAGGRARSSPTAGRSGPPPPPSPNRRLRRTGPLAGPKAGPLAAPTACRTGPSRGPNPHSGPEPVPRPQLASLRGALASPPAPCHPRPGGPLPATAPARPASGPCIRQAPLRLPPRLPLRSPPVPPVAAGRTVAGRRAGLRSAPPRSTNARRAPLVGVV